MYEYDIALNTHLVALLCENGVGWFIQLETQLWSGSQGSEWGGPWDNTGSIEGFRVGAVMVSFTVASFGAGDWLIMGRGRWMCPGGRSSGRLILCNRCWPGSEAASPGRCRRGVRSLRSPSRSAGSRLSPMSAEG